MCQSTSACGNGRVDPPESCESDADCPDPVAQFCSACQCLLRCGNGVVDGNEQCEDAGQCAPGEGCNSLCQYEVSCGNGVLDAGETCDEGINNSDLPNATCRTDCSPQRCGDGIVDGAFGEACEVDGDCSGGGSCTACQCQAPLGLLNFSPVTGPGGSDTAPGCPAEPSNGSLLKTHGGPTGGIPGAVCNGTLGDFCTVGGPIQLMGGVPDANGSSAPTKPVEGPYVLGGGDAGPGAAVIMALVKRLPVGGTCPAAGDAAWNNPDSQLAAILVAEYATS